MAVQNLVSPIHILEALPRTTVHNLGQIEKGRHAQLAQLLLLNRRRG